MSKLIIFLLTLISISYSMLSTELHKAIEENNIQKVKQLIESGVDVNSRDESGFLPIVTSIIKHQNNIFNHLLSCQSIKLDIINNERQSLLHVAIFANNLYALDCLIKRGLYKFIALQDNKGYTSLHYAAKNHKIQALSLLLNYLSTPRYSLLFKEILNQQDSFGNTVLHYVVHSNDVNMVNTLLQLGVDIDIKNNQNNSPLLLATMNNNISIASVLLENGANIDDFNDLGYTPFSVALCQNNELMCNLLKEKEVDRGWTLYSALKLDNFSLANTLISKGISVNEKICDIMVNDNRNENLQGFGILTLTSNFLLKKLFKYMPNQKISLLLALMKLGNINAVLFLLENGVDVSEKDKDGNTLLHLIKNYFFKKEVLKIAVKLVEKGLSINIKNKFGETPLMYAANTCMEDKAMFGVVEYIKFLINNGADIYTQNNKGQNVLHYAVKCDYILETLLKYYDKNINIQDKEGNTPVHMSIHIPILKTLCNNGADFSIANNEGIIPMHHFIKIDKLSLFNNMINHSPDINFNIINNQYETPLECLIVSRDKFNNHNKKKRYLKYANLVSKQLFDTIYPSLYYSLGDPAYHIMQFLAGKFNLIKHTNKNTIVGKKRNRLDNFEHSRKKRRIIK